MDLRFDASELGAAVQGLRVSTARIIGAAAGAMREEHELIMTKAKGLTPVLTGALRASGYVQPTEGLQSGRLVSTGGFGGPAVSYAVYVHENLTARHHVGQAKFYEQPWLEAVAGMADRLAARISAEAMR